MCPNVPLKKNIIRLDNWPLGGNDPASFEKPPASSWLIMALWDPFLNPPPIKGELVL